MSVPKIILENQLNGSIVVFLKLEFLLSELKVSKMDYTVEDVRKYTARILYGKMKR